jgi:sigma-E factor negative regulatory protein RseA
MMNDDNREWLSALADGELEGAELKRALDALHNDAELQASWSAYHLIRDSVSSNLDEGVAPQLHLRISAALQDEPTILAPQPRRRSWVKQAAGLAIAASVAGVAVVGVQQMNSAGSAPAVQTVAQQQEYIRMAPTLVAEGKEKPQPKSEGLDRYLVNHNEYSANSGIQGVLPYVRIVGHKVAQ